MEEEERAKRERVKNNTPAQLAELATKFPKQISMLDEERVRYPWFKPFENRPIMAMPLWSGEGETGRYVTVEPLRKGGWKFSTVTMLHRGATPMRREQHTLKTPEEAAIRVRMALGSRAPHLERQAPWRQKPSSSIQQKTWKRLFPRDPEDPEQMTAGEIWDAVSQERFRRRVDPKAL